MEHPVAKELDSDDVKRQVHNPEYRNCTASVWVKASGLFAPKDTFILAIILYVLCAKGIYVHMYHLPDHSKNSDKIW
jgi:hypothetical protein